MKKVNKKILTTCLTGGAAILVIVITLIVVAKNITTDILAPETQVQSDSDNTNIVYDFTEDVTDTSEEYVSEYAKLFDDPKRLEADLGDYQGKYELDKSKVKGLISGLIGVMSNATEQQRAAAEYLLLNNPGYSIQHVQMCTKKVPKYYGGDDFWLFEDSRGYVGELVVKGSHMYLYYYGELQLEDDAILLAGLPATSHGEIQPYMDELMENELYKDLPIDEADAVLFAIQNGEGFSQTDHCYLMYQTSFTYSDLFEDVKAYFINLNVSQVFIEVYISDGKYYNIRSTNPLYKELVPSRLMRNVELSEETETRPDVVDAPESKITVDSFYDAIYKEFVWDGKNKKLSDLVSNTEAKNGNVLQILQYGLDHAGIDDCKLIIPTDAINGYTVYSDNIFEIRLSDSEEGLPDYYASVIESSKTFVLYKPDVTPKL